METPAIDVSQQLTQAQGKGKRRMVGTNKNTKDAGLRRGQQEIVDYPTEHKLLKVVKQEK